MNEKELQDAAQRLPRSIEPPEDLWPGIRQRMRRRKYRPLLWVPLALAAGIAAILLLKPRDETWTVQRVAGAPRVNDAPLGGSGTMRVGAILQTDDSSRATIVVGGIGRVDVAPGSRIRLVRALATDHRLALAYGAIHAKVDAPPRLFFVDTPAGTAVDLGCEYVLETDSSGRGRLHVTGGYVEFAWGGARSVIPVDAYADTRPQRPPGVPYVSDAPAGLVAALDSFAFASGGAAAVRAALAAARSEDAISLWHLLSRVDATDRGAVYDRLAILVPPPAGVARSRALALDQQTLESYWGRIERIHFRIVVLRGIREIDARTGTTEGDGKRR
ncbi:MAG TPA: FecR domain-containing protein [Gemmatimonadales bacterium]|nr:FecR domain-containing protein [Gemmatimonadales bacterium]